MSLPRRDARLTAAAWLAIGLAACSADRRGSEAAPAAPPSGPPTAAELAGATYGGLDVTTGPVTLVNGSWEGAAFVEGGASRPTVTLLRGSRVAGDLDADGEEEAVVLLAESYGGSGTLLQLAVMDRVDGAVVNAATRVLGDRVQVRDLAIEQGLIRIDVVRTGPGDPACCPGELAVYRWGERGQRLVDQEPEEVVGRLSLGVLEGEEWRLTRFDRDTPAPESPAVTLRYADGRFQGSAGCAAYSAPAVDRTEGPAGGVMVGPPAAALPQRCDEQAAAVEERFLRLLGSTIKFSFGAGRLLLHHATGTMSFARVGQPAR